ncbi:CDP-glycerol glycerophosphotransferase family protein [uncultured Cohaesibacter sp.]|uniref:CDP-glycerol glycerophosphotransferase family protein n=1 Tax=uncultured Cohaesibacter sp. TaxID=1002546 RepID=UPI0029C6BB81|nr:CDP-glycerol glycerophosphotransferase family protein [uncultured Cohaesibacter sp.]
MVLVAHNAGSDIGRFLESILAQDSSIKDLELIIVDGASTDSTPQILADYASLYQTLIRVVRQERLGDVAARNKGLGIACGKWVSFPDPGDILDAAYMRHCRRAVKSRYKRPLLAVCTNALLYSTDKDEVIDKHPLRFRFKERQSTVTTSDMKRHFQLSGKTVWLDRLAIEKHGLRFEGQGWAGFEEALFINRLFLLEARRSVTFLREARTYCSRSDAGNSFAIDGALGKSYYLDMLDKGTLELIRLSESIYGYVPKFIQRVVLFPITHVVRRVLDNPDVVRQVLDPEELREMVRLLKDNLRYVDPDVIENFPWAGMNVRLSIGILAYFKSARRKRSAVYLKGQTASKRDFTFSWHCGASEDYRPDALINGERIEFVARKVQTLRFLDAPFCTIHETTIELGEADEIAFSFDAEAADIRSGARKIGASVARAELVEANIIPAPSEAALEAQPNLRRLRQLIISDDMRRIYQGCWVLMDHVNRADDNAEHLYRHLMGEPHLADRLWFVLQRDCADWERLDKEGFRLLDYASDEHVCALYNADLFVSSHLDEIVLSPFPQSFFLDLARYKFVFLRHGVAKDDMSRWMNSKSVDAIVSSSFKEFHSIASPDSPYKFTEREVVLTGFPRHDRLLKMGREASQTSLLIMPTWRNSLDPQTLGQLEDEGDAAVKRDRFRKSEFFRHWSTFLSDPRLLDLANERGLRVVFVPHPKIVPYIDEFSIPDGVTMFNVCEGAGYQDLFAECTLLVTDYSSVAFDVAYLMRPVVYFQFDKEAVFGGQHTYRTGFFQYERDGFGPVVESADDLFAEMQQILDGDLDPAYRQRAEAFFEFRDGRCCERVQQVLENLTATMHQEEQKDGVLDQLKQA